MTAWHKFMSLVDSKISFDSSIVELTSNVYEITGWRCRSDAA